MFRVFQINDLSVWDVPSQDLSLARGAFQEPDGFIRSWTLKVSFSVCRVMISLRVISDGQILIFALCTFVHLVRKQEEIRISLLSQTITGDRIKVKKLYCLQCAPTSSLSRRRFYASSITPPSSRTKDCVASSRNVRRWDHTACDCRRKLALDFISFLKWWINLFQCFPWLIM